MLGVVAGWAGDVQTLMADAYVELKRNGTGFADEFYGMLGDEQHSLGMEDLFADVDAKNLYENLGSSEEVPQDIRDAFRIYYQNHYTGLKERVPQFTGYASKSSYLGCVKTYTHNIYSPMLVWPLMFVHNPSARVFTCGQSDDAARIFTDFLMG